MQPQYPQLPQPSAGGYTPYRPPDAPRSKKWLWIVLILVLLGAGIGAGVYFWQQSQTGRENNQTVQQPEQNQSEQTEQTTQTVEFTGPQLPFTFKRPSDWVLQSESALNYDNAPVESYGLTLYAPGTVETGSPIGGTELAAGGASIILSVSKAPAVTAPEDIVSTLPGTKPTVTKITVAGQPAIEYEYAYESPSRIYTQLVKDGRIYTLMFEKRSGENLREGDNYKVYQGLVKSFTFK